MEAAAGVAAARGVSLPMTAPQPSRKEWRAVPEQSTRNSSGEDLGRSKLGQSDERLIYEVQQGREPADVDFCSITIEGSSDNDILQQRLQSLVKQREDLQQMEVGLRAQLIARSEMSEIQNAYDCQIKEHQNANFKLQEQLHERERTIRELERKMEEKERELHAIRLDNEAAWAKEDLFREQSKELATFRRERDNTEAERTQNLKQIHDLQDHMQEKERQFMELQEQHRVAQETILFKDEQLREAQAWIARVQEMDALQSTTNHSLQAELRERTEQYNQLWLACQRQFAEMERIYAHSIQQLQHELAGARERNGSYSDESQISQVNSGDVSQFGQSNGSKLEVSGNSPSNGNSGSLPNGNAEKNSPFVSENGTTQTEHVHGVPLAPSSLLGVPSYLPTGQVTALHPFVMHQQGVPHSIPSHVPQSHVGHFHSAPSISSIQHWPNQQAVSEGSQQTQNQYPPSQTDQNLLRPDANYGFEVPVNEQTLHSDYLDVHVSQGVEPNSVVPSSNEVGQAIETIDKSYLVDAQTQQNLQQISSQFHDALSLNPLPQITEAKETNKSRSAANHGIDAQGLMKEQTISAANVSSPEAPVLPIKFGENSVKNATGVVMSESFVSTGKKNTIVAGKAADTPLLDERSLLACIVRTIPPGSGGRIRISSTLPNRLGKMLAPLHWHDYKKKYGKLDDFVASHPELFVIEGDYIQLREGAQETIAATAAVAKVAAAAAATSSHSSLLPSVAVTPMAQSHRLKKTPSIDSNKVDKTIFKEHVVPGHANATEHHPELSAMQNQLPNGVSFNVGGGGSTVKILTKSKDRMETSSSGSRAGHSFFAVGNGANADGSVFGSSKSESSTHGRPTVNYSAKQSGRTTGAVSSSRR